MHDIGKLREKRREAVYALCNRIQAIDENSGDSVNKYDPAGIEYPLAKLNEIQQLLIEKADKLNEYAEDAGRPRLRITHTSFIGR